MTIVFECSKEKVTLFYDGNKIEESPRGRKLQFTGKDFIPKFTGTKVEDIPTDISFYIGNLQCVYPSLSAISLDNSKNGINIRLMSDYVDLNSWNNPFSFDEYIQLLESSIYGLIPPIKKFYKPSYSDANTLTVFSLDFFISSGDITEKISQCIDDFSRAHKTANNTLLKDKSLLIHSPHREYNFVNDEKCSLEEDLHTEFKEIKEKNPLNSIQRHVDEYILAFLNSEGGSIFWGICDNGIVKGLSLSLELKDKIRKTINSKINTIEPPIDPTQIGVFFHPVSNIKEGFVLEVSIPKSNSRKLYFNTSGDTWVRLNGCKKKLQGNALQDYIIHRNKNVP